MKGGANMEVTHDMSDQELKALLKKQGLSTAVGDEGGFAPNLPDAKTALQYLKQAVELAGYRMGKDIRIALDIAASELYNADFKTYEFPGESKMCGKKVIRSAEELIDYYEELDYQIKVATAKLSSFGVNVEDLTL